MALDPFTIIYADLCEAIVKHGPLTRLVRPRNFIRFDGVEMFPTKPEVQVADFPEIDIRDMGLSDIDLQSTSSRTSMIGNYEVMVSTADLRVNKQLYPVRYEILRALNVAKNAIPALRGWVKSVSLMASPIGGNSGADGDPSPKGIPGWTSILAIRVQMMLSTAGLATENFDWTKGV